MMVDPEVVGDAFGLNNKHGTERLVCWNLLRRMPDLMSLLDLCEFFYILPIVMGSDFAGFSIALEFHC